MCTSCNSLHLASVTGLVPPYHCGSVEDRWLPLHTSVSNSNTAMHGYTSPLMAPQLGDLANATISLRAKLCGWEGKFNGYQNAFVDDLLVKSTPTGPTV